MRMNLRRVLFLFFLLILPIFGFSENRKAVTFGWGGRLGDNLLDYTHAKWISYKQGIPLLFQTFEYSDQFVFDDVEEKLTQENQSQYATVILKSLSQIEDKITQNTLYFLPHTCDSYDEFIFNGSYGTFVDVDWSDPNFKRMMQRLIAPKKSLNLDVPPNDVISVALHYRNGGGFVWDTDKMKHGLPLRFPENVYYFKQLKKLHSLVGHQPIYVHIFTDHPAPEEIKLMFEAKFLNTNIEFGCRTEGNRHDANVLEDLFSMMNFDCLIRPMSHYSMTASHLGDFKIEIFPIHGYFSGENKFIVDKVRIIQKSVWDIHKNKWKTKKEQI